MPVAFKCSRCGKFSDDLATKNEFVGSGDLGYIIFDAGDRKPFDLCDNCLNALEAVISEWWHGLAPK